MKFVIQIRLHKDFWLHQLWTGKMSTMCLCCSNNDIGNRGKLVVTFSRDVGPRGQGGQLPHQILAHKKIKPSLSKGFKLLIVHRILAGIDSKPFPSKVLGLFISRIESNLWVTNRIRICRVPRVLMRQTAIEMVCAHDSQSREPPLKSLGQKVKDFNSQPNFQTFWQPWTCVTFLSLRVNRNAFLQKLPWASLKRALYNGFSLKWIYRN